MLGSNVLMVHTNVCMPCVPVPHSHVVRCHTCIINITAQESVHTTGVCILSLKNKKIIKGIIYFLPPMFGVLTVERNLWPVKRFREKHNGVALLMT